MSSSTSASSPTSSSSAAASPGSTGDGIVSSVVTGIMSMTHGLNSLNVGGGVGGVMDSCGGGGGVNERDPQFVFASFNQDTTSLSIGTTKGFSLYQLNDELESVHRSGRGEVYIAERLFSSSLVAIVTREDPRTLRVCHFNKGTEITRRKFDTKILSVKLNREVLIVCLEESLYINNIRDMTCMHVINETPPNRAGLCALTVTSASHGSTRSYLAYPGHSTVGELQIFDATNLSSKTVVPAHSSNLVAISFSPCGRRVATSSEKGTVIRIFNVDDGGSRVFELRRGLKRTVNIYSLSFSPCGRFLASSSNTETVHVFRLDVGEATSSGAAGAGIPGKHAESGGQVINPSSGPSSAGSASSPLCSPPDSGGWLGYLNTVVSASAISYLPSQVSDTLLQGRAFATVHHNQPGMKNVCALAIIKRKLTLVVASEDGYVYYYDLNLEEGGDCAVIKQFNVTSSRGGGAKRRNNAGNSEEEDDDNDNNEEEVASSGSPEDSEKFHEMSVATASPPQQCFLLDDDGEFPPMI